MKIRTHVFETNSSSTHSIVVSHSGKIAKQPFDDAVTAIGVLKLEATGEYGWEERRYYDTLSKLDYLAVYCNEDPGLWEIAQDTIKQYSGVEVRVISCTGYIDHQSAVGEDGSLADVIRGDGTLIRWLFNPKSCVITDNDNH